MNPATLHAWPNAISWCSLPRLVLIAGLLVRAVPAAANGTSYTDCVHLCPTGWPNVDPCVVSTAVAVVAGSAIECGSRTVIIQSGGSLTVTDGAFSLAAGHLQMTGNGLVKAACTANGIEQPGVAIDVTGSVSVANSAKFDLTCANGGGWLRLGAETTVTFTGTNTAIDATGQGATAPGGNITVRAKSTLSTTAAITADTTSTQDAPGGAIELRGDGVTVGGGLTVDGAGENGGGTIWIDSRAAVAINGTGMLSASTTQGPGGGIGIAAVGDVTIDRMLRVRGTGGTGTAGAVTIEGRSISVQHEILATGGSHGGSVELLSERGAVSVGTTGSQAALLDVSATGSAAGDAGAVRMVSRGGDVTVGSNGSVHASGNSGGRGGSIVVEGVALSLASGSEVLADDGGGVSLRSQEAAVLGGTLRATDGLIKVGYRSTSPTIGSGVVDPVDTYLDPMLTAGCGDGRRRLGAEGCDRGDLDHQTCTSTGHGTGDLQCDLTTCQLSFSSCSN